ncbi:MAG: acetate kinase [Burkholderiales bacterium]|nr:acetate kinase [Burkholderiales bacterium]
MRAASLLRRSALPALCVALTLPPASAAAGDGGASALQRELDAAREEMQRLRSALQQQARRLEQQEQALDRQGRRLRRLERSMVEQGSAAQAGVGDSVLRASTGTGPGGARTQQPVQPQQAVPGQQAVPAQQSAPAPPPATVGQAPPQPADTRPPEIAPIFDQPGVLTPRGKFVLEPAFEYSYSNSTRVSVIGFEIFPAILVGVLDIRTANRSSYSAILTGRYGITNRLEAEIKLPWVYRTETLQAREFLEASFADDTFHADGNGLGDVELALRYQFNQGGVEKPYYIGTLRLKTRTGTDPFEVDLEPSLPHGGGRLRELPTGTGFIGLRPELTVIYPSDPVVFFGSVHYLWNIKRNDVKTQLGSRLDIDPGDAFGFNFGMGLALNDRASFSVGYEHTTYLKNEIDGRTPASDLTVQLGSLLVGYSYKIGSRSYLNLALGVGATRDAPDVQINLRFPTTF